MGSSLNNQDIAALLGYVMRRRVIGRGKRCIKKKEDTAASGQHRLAPVMTSQSVFKLHFKRVFPRQAEAHATALSTSEGSWSDAGCDGCHREAWHSLRSLCDAISSEKPCDTVSQQLEYSKSQDPKFTRLLWKKKTTKKKTRYQRCISAMVFRRRSSRL